MAEAAKDQDQSMEDILQSIKRIIAEEGEVTPEDNAEDVLELTELLADDGSVSRTQMSDGQSADVGSLSIDEIMAAPLASMAKPAAVPAAAVEMQTFDDATMEPEAEPETAPAPTPPPMPATPVAAAPAPVARGGDDEGLISGTTLSASVAALNALRDSLSAPPPASSQVSFRSGVTVEDLVLESLKPMLKDWLDGNLQRVVETLVQKEISKLSK